MARDSDSPGSRSPTSVLVAGLIFIVAGWLLLHFVLHLIVAVASVVVVVVAIAALVWALRVLL